MADAIFSGGCDYVCHFSCAHTRTLHCRFSTGDFYEGDAQALKLFTNKRFHLVSAMHACRQPTPAKGERAGARLLAPPKPSREAIAAAESRRKEFLCWGFLAFASNARGPGTNDARQQGSEPRHHRALPQREERGGVETRKKALNQHWLLVQEQAAEFLASQACFLEECVLLHQRHHALVLSQLAQGQNSLLLHPPQDEEVEEDNEEHEEEDEEEGPHNWSRGEEKEVLRAGSKDNGTERQGVEDWRQRLSTHEDQRQFRGQVADTVTVLNWGRSHLDRGVPQHVSGTRKAAGRSRTEEQLPAGGTEGRKRACAVPPSRASHASHASHGDKPNAADTEQALDADEVADESDACHNATHVRFMAAVGSVGQARSQAHLRWAQAQSRADEAATLLLRSSAWGEKHEGVHGAPDCTPHHPATPPPPPLPNPSALGMQGADTGKRHVHVPPHSQHSQHSPSKMSVRVLDKDGNRCIMF